MTEKILEMINTYLDSLPDERRKNLDKAFCEDELKKLERMHFCDESTRCTYLAQAYSVRLSDIIAKEEHISFANGKISIMPVRSTFDDTTIANFEVYLNGIIRCIEDLKEYPELQKQVLERLKAVFSRNLRKRQYEENIELLRKVKEILLSEATKKEIINRIENLKFNSPGNLTFPFDDIISELNQTEMPIKQMEPFTIYSASQKIVQSKDYIGVYPFENFEPEYIIMLKNYILLDPERIFNSECSEAYQQLENKAKDYIVYIGTLLENSKNIPQTINRINNENQELFCEARNNTSTSSSKVPQHLKKFRELFIYNMLERRDSSGKVYYLNPSNIPELNMSDCGVDLKKAPYDELTAEMRLKKKILERGLLEVLVESIAEGIENSQKCQPKENPKKRIYRNRRIA